MPPALADAKPLVSVEFKSFPGVSPLPTPLIAPVGYLVDEPVRVPGAFRPSLDDDPALLRLGRSPPVAFAYKPKRDDDPARDNPPGFSPVASFCVCVERSVEFRPVLPTVFFSSGVLPSLVKVWLSDFWPASPVFREPVAVLAIPVSPCLILRSSSNFACFSLILSAFEIMRLWPGFVGLPALPSNGDLASV